jgi:protein phosphatase
MAETNAAPLNVSVAMYTDAGKKRADNLDAIGNYVPDDPLVLGRLGQLFVLADASPDLERGDLASQYAVSTILSSYYEQPEGAPAERLARAIAEANNVIFAEAIESGLEMGTAVLSAVVRGNELIIGSVGDCPAFLIRDGAPRRLTPEPPAAVLAVEQPARLLGVSHSARVDVISGRVRSGDCVVLGSASLTRSVTPEEIAQMVGEQAGQQAAEALVTLANERDGDDDVSVIVLQLSSDLLLAQLPPIPDPMQAWGLPRRARRTRAVETIAEQEEADERLEQAQQMLRAAWQTVRGNTLLAIGSMVVALVLFGAFILALSGLGGEEEAKPTPIPPADLTVTAEIGTRAAAQAIAQATADAALAATQAEIARLTLTPPTPVPTSGPQMESGLWFRVLEGDPIPAYDVPSVSGQRLTDLEPGSTYRVSGVNREAQSGPWYQVVDNLGEEVRWVNGPSLHARIVAVNDAGDPLPPDQQPLDVPPPGEARQRAPTPSPRPLSPSPTLAESVTPGTPGVATPSTSPTATSRPAISYGVESWEVGRMVVMRADLNLCRIPDVTACDIGRAAAGEMGTIVEGPVPAGEHWWWEVEFQDGRAGWIAQVLLGTP